MIVKKADDKTAALATLESLHLGADSRKQKFIEDELRMMRAGIKGEQESAYHIDFDFGASELTSVIHDLRLEIGGRVAQIDHLIVHRTQKFYVLETKSFSHGLKITDDGEFLRWNDWKKTYEGMASPIEQNRRHVEVLTEALVKLGYVKPHIESFVLISSTARIDRSKLHPSPEVVKADQFTTAFKKRFSDSMNSVGSILGGLSKVLFGESAEAIAKQLVGLHRPIAIDYAARFGVSVASPTAAINISLPIDLAEIRAKVVPTNAVSAFPKTSTQVAAPACKECGSTRLAVEYGKFGYYFKCKACDANTALKIGCEIPGHKERIRKSRLTFYRECELCDSSSIFHVNEAQ